MVPKTKDQDKYQAQYLDFQATTPVDPKVFDKMKPYLIEHFGNPSSQDHAWGWTASRAVEKARVQVSQLLGCLPAEIFFTSGATEANNWTLFGLVRRLRRESPLEKIHIVTSEIEHKSVLAPLKYLLEEIPDRNLFDVSFVKADRWGRISLERIQEQIQPSTKLVSLNWAHNELGSVQAVAEIASFCHEHEIYFHTDATQAVGKLEIDLQKIAVDLLSLSAHKLYGPKGVGALFIRNHNPKVSLDPLIFGGSQERGLRSGTLNVPGIVGLGEACEIAKLQMLTDNQKYQQLRHLLITKMQELVPGLIINTHPEQHLPHAVSMTFPQHRFMNLQNFISHLALSSGSACSSGELSGSPVLKSIGHNEDLAQSTIRLSLGRWTTEKDVVEIIESFKHAVEQQIAQA